MKSFIYIMGVALLLVFCSCEKQGEQEQGTCLLYTSDAADEL